MKTIFEEMGGTYRQVGDYFIPNITLPDDGELLWYTKVVTFRSDKIE